jgi:phospholipid/cholesterol/gamma-HCH transport system permease protein
MPVQADFTFDKAGGDKTVVLSGDWTARGLFDAGVRLADALHGAEGASLDLSQVNRCDTAGAYAIIRAADGRQSAGKIKARKEILRLFELVGNAVQVEPEVIPRSRGFQALLERIGRGMFGLADDVFSTMVFLGHLLTALGRCIVDPRRIRWAPIVSLAERAGLDAMPIVATTTFFIGAVVALLGANMLVQFGAEVYSVELIGISVLREFNILITAILLAGRSASSLRGRDRLDEDEPGDRRHAGHGRRSVRGPGPAALRRPAADHPAADLRRHPGGTGRRHAGDLGRAGPRPASSCSGSSTMWASPISGSACPRRRSWPR